MKSEIDAAALNITVTRHYKPAPGDDGSSPSSQEDTTIGAFVAAAAKAGQEHDPAEILAAILVKGEYVFSPAPDSEVDIITYAEIGAAERVSWRIEDDHCLLVGYRETRRVVAIFPTDSHREAAAAASQARCIAAIRAVPDLIAARDALVALLGHWIFDDAPEDDELLNRARAAVAATIAPGAGNK